MKIVKEFILREIAGETILVPTGTAAQEFNGMLSMTDTARFIWEHLETVQSLEEMVKIMLDTYEIDEKTATQETFLLVMRSFKLMEMKKYRILKI